MTSGTISPGEDVNETLQTVRTFGLCVQVKDNAWSGIASLFVAHGWIEI